ncbi:ribosome maturation factor RimP [Gordonia sp. DT219]|uniref:ribosome maturation factor RimP n=1 Tax=Gordonia sp. DT219 TaxID=3416658 RepID=UPI003CF06098
MAIDQTKVRELVERFVRDRGLDLEDVIISTSSGPDKSGADEIQLIVDRDGGTDLDLLGALTRDVSDELDAHDEYSDAPYTLEVTSPGIGRPLTLPRHWRRSRGRRVHVRRDSGPDLTGRIGALTDAAVEIVVNNRGRITTETIPFDTVERAVVEVDFSRPSAAELQRCGLDDEEIAQRRDPGPTEL